MPVGRPTLPGTADAGSQKLRRPDQLRTRCPFAPSVAREPRAHYEGVDLVDELGGHWNPFVYAGDPDRNGRILRERTARDQAIEKGSQHGG
jgi:hypothetical protein